MDIHKQLLKELFYTENSKQAVELLQLYADFILSSPQHFSDKSTNAFKIINQSLIQLTQEGLLKHKGNLVTIWRYLEQNNTISEYLQVCNVLAHHFNKIEPIINYLSVYKVITGRHWRPKIKIYQPWYNLCFKHSRAISDRKIFLEQGLEDLLSKQYITLESEQSLKAYLPLLIQGIYHKQYRIRQAAMQILAALGGEIFYHQEMTSGLQDKITSIRQITARALKLTNSYPVDKEDLTNYLSELYDETWLYNLGKLEANFIDHHQKYHLDLAMLGKSFLYKDNKYTILGIETKNHTYPVIANNYSKKRLYKFTAEKIREKVNVY